MRKSRMIPASMMRNLYEETKTMNRKDVKVVRRKKTECLLQKVQRNNSMEAKTGERT